MNIRLIQYGLLSFKLIIWLIFGLIKGYFAREITIEYFLLKEITGKGIFFNSVMISYL